MYINGTQTQTLPRRSLVISFSEDRLFFRATQKITIFYIWGMVIASLIGATTFLPSLGLNIALALGAPLGAYAMGAKYTVIPKELRPAFIMPIVMQFAALWFLLTAGDVLPHAVCHLIPNIITTIFAFFFALYITFYTVTLLFSISYKEKKVMGSFGIVTTVCYWITSISTVVR